MFIIAGNFNTVGFGNLLMLTDFVAVAIPLDITYPPGISAALQPHRHQASISAARLWSLKKSGANGFCGGGV
jgi:hypothetical protein